MPCTQTPSLPESYFLHIYNFTYLLINISSIFTIIKLFHTGRVWEHQIHFNVDFVESVYPLKGSICPKPITVSTTEEAHGKNRKDIRD